MNFSEAARTSSSYTYTENGAIALNTTGSKLVDFFSLIGSLRTAENNRIETLFADAYQEDPLAATKIAFYSRDIREGLGERRTFKVLLNYMANFHPEALVNNLHLISEYGRYDDLYSLIGTKLEDDMWKIMKQQFQEDLENMHNNQPISLLAKWIKTADAKSKATRKLGITTAIKLGYRVYDFKRLVVKMRKYIKITESYMSSKRWDEIDYSAVPSKAMLNYRNAFIRHDYNRFHKYMEDLAEGKTTINSSTLYPYDLVNKLTHGGSLRGFRNAEYDEVIEAQWKELPNYVTPGSNVIIMADTSGSMTGAPLLTAVSLAIYFAERNTGLYHNLWMSFSSNPKFHELKGENLYQKLSNIDMTDWESSTDLQAAFTKILYLAKENRVPPEEMPQSLIVISDMEIDYCDEGDKLFYNNLKDKFESYRYKIPNVVFWNVNSRHNIFHADATRPGVQLASGQSATVFKEILESVGCTPKELVYNIVNKHRYDPISIRKVG